MILYLLTFFQVGYFVGGVASLESSEIAGIAVTFTAIALVLLVLALVFLVRQRGKCVSLRSHQTSSLNVTSQNGVKSTPTANGHLVLQEKALSTNGHAIHHNVSFNFTLYRLRICYVKYVLRLAN